MQVGEGPERKLDRRVKNQIQRGQEEDNRVPVWTTWSSRRGGGVAGPPASISLGFDVAACGRSLVILSVESGDGKDGVKAQQERGAGLAVKGERKRPSRELGEWGFLQAAPSPVGGERREGEEGSGRSGTPRA